MNDTIDYESLLQRCADKAYNFAYRLSGNDQDAQDLVQEAFARAFEHKDRYDPNRPFGAWVNRILYNVFLDGVRRYERKHSVSIDTPLQSKNDQGTWADILRGTDIDPVNSLIKKEEEKMIHDALQKLPVHYRTAVILYDIEGLSYDDIVNIMGCPLGTVCSRIHKGRQLLKQAIVQTNKKEVTSTL